MKIANIILIIALFLLTSKSSRSEDIGSMSDFIRISYGLLELTIYKNNLSEIEYGMTLHNGGKIGKNVFNYTDLKTEIMSHPNPMIVKKSQDGGVVYVSKKGNADVSIVENEKEVYNGYLEKNLIIPIFAKAFNSIQPYNVEEFNKIREKYPIFSQELKKD